MLERILIIILVNLIFFYKKFYYHYASDDIPASQRPKHPNKIIQWLGVLEGRARSIPQIDHLLTTLITTATSVFIYVGFGATDISFIAAFLYAFNPFNNQGSVWIAGRAYAVSAMGIVAVMALPILSPLSLALTTYYPAGFLAPLAFLFHPDLQWVAFLVPLAWALHFRRFRKNVKDKMKMEMVYEDKQVKPEKLILFTKTFGYYLAHSIFPLKLSFYHSFLQSAAGVGKEKAYAWKDKFFFLGLAWFAFFAWHLATHPFGLTTFAIMLYVITIAPFCNFFRVQQECAERYSILPNVGLMYLLATFLAPYPYLTLGFIVFYATRLWFYMDVYQNDFFLTEFASMYSPDSWFAWHVRAMKRWEAKSHQEALIYWTMARQLSPNEFKLNLNIATVLGLSQNPEHRKQAVQFLDIAEKNIPKGQEEQGQKLCGEWRKGNMSIVL